MRKLVKTSAALFLALILMVGLLPMQAFAAERRLPEVSYILEPMGGVDPDSDTIKRPTSIAKGMYFGATFGFMDPEGESMPSGATSIKIEVSASGVWLKKTSYTFADTGSAAGCEIFIPESEMRYTGSGPAIMKFSITYVGATGGSKTLKCQKTITECTATGGTDTETGKPTNTLLLDSYTTSSTNIKEGQKFDLNLVIKNTSSGDYTNLVIKLEGLTSESLTVNGQTDTKTLARLAAGTSATITFPMVCAPKMSTGNQVLSVSLSADGAAAAGTGATDTPQVSSTKLFVPVTGTASKEGDKPVETSAPQIIVHNYDYGGASVVGGKVFTLKMDFQNTSPNISIENLKMTISPAQDEKVVNAFTPANASNTYFNPKIGAAAAFQWSIDLLPKADADPKPYGLTVTYTFEYVADGKRIKSEQASETIAIPLDQPDRFTVEDAEVNSPVFMGEAGQLMVNYVNMGKSKIFNLAVKVTGDGFTTQDGSLYVGNVDSGSSDSFQAGLEPTQAGTVTGKVAFSYEDAAGNVKNVEKDFTFEVQEMQMMDPGMMPGVELGPDGKPIDPNAPKGMPVWVWPVIGVGIIVVAIIVTVVVRKKMKKRKQRLQNESDSYDDESDELADTSTGPKDGDAK